MDDRGPLLALPSAVPDPADTGFQPQDGQLRPRGMELEGEWSPLPGRWLQGGYAYLDAEITKPSTPAPLCGRIAETARKSRAAAMRVEMGRVERRSAANYVGTRKIIDGGAFILPAYGTFLTDLFDKTNYFSDNPLRYSLGTEHRDLPGEPRPLSVRGAHRFRGAQR